MYDDFKKDVLILEGVERVSLQEVDLWRRDGLGAPYLAAKAHLDRVRIWLAEARQLATGLVT